MRKLDDMELMLRADEIRAIGEAVHARSDRMPKGDELFAQALNGILHVWDHEGTLVLVQVHVRGRRSVATLCYGAGTLQPLLDWYAAWEEECRRYHVDEIRIGGRKGWYRVQQRLGLGGERESDNWISKRLH
ncbi:MAG TPA: hypothetical protein VJ833_10125 [Rhodanobacteraceae bacterium]|nr:hypothetical protein [Rhodanobacteraceae bacterium]